MVQQRQPLESRTVLSSTVSTSWWSMPTSPNSLMSTAASPSEGCFKSWLSSVVLPLPRKPVSTMIGVSSV